MPFETVIDVVIMTTYGLTALMVLMVILRVEREIIGDKRSWYLIVILCLMLTVRTIGDFMEPLWVRTAQQLLGIGAGILYPWVLWKIYNDTRGQHEPEKTR